MNEETLGTLIEQALMSGAPQVSFVWQGGEPTLAGLEFFRKAVQLQDLYRYPNQKIQNSIQTNGVIIDEEWADFFSEEDWLVGVSLDGPQGDHDTYRTTREGSGSCGAVKRAIEILRRQGVRYNVLTLLNNVNVRKPRELYRWLKGERHKHIQFIPCLELDQKGEIAGFAITPEEYGYFLVEVFDEWERDIPEVYVRDFEDLLIGIVSGKTLNCVYNGRCGEYLVVEYNGDVYPCDFFVEPEWLLGNVNETGFEELFMSEKMIQFRESRKLHQTCDGCSWIGYCHGGCQKTLLGEENYFCESIKYFLEQRETEIRTIADRVAVKYR